MTEKDSESREPVPLNEATYETLAGLFDSPDFRGAVDSALEEHLELLNEYREKGTLSPDKEERFTRISSFIEIAGEIMQEYRRPENED